MGQQKPPPRTSSHTADEAKILLAEMLDSAPWFSFLEQIVSPYMKRQRTDLQKQAREATDPDLGLLFIAKSQARVDAVIDMVYAVYDKIGTPKTDLPYAVTLALGTPAEIR